MAKTKANHSDGARVEGIERLLKVLGKLPDKVVLKLERGALKKAMDPVYQEALRLVPQRNGALRASLKVRTRRFDRRKRLLVELKAQSPHAHLMELGFWLTKRTKGGKKRRIKWIPPQAFLKPALEKHATEARKIFADALRESLEELRTDS